MNPWIRAIAVAIAAAVHAAAAMEFNFKDPKGVNTVYFLLDSELEPIMGTAAGISGTLSFDPAKLKETTGKIIVEAKSITFPNKGMTDTLHGADWMDSAKNSEISFTFKEVKEAKPAGENQWELTVGGEFLCKGISKPATATVRATLQPGKLENRMRGKKGDLLVLRSEFTIKRSEYALNMQTPTSIVADDIQIRVAIVGYREAK